MSSTAGTVTQVIIEDPFDMASCAVAVLLTAARRQHIGGGAL